MDLKRVLESVFGITSFLWCNPIGASESFESYLNKEQRSCKVTTYGREDRPGSNVVKVNINAETMEFLGRLKRVSGNVGCCFSKILEELLVVYETRQKKNFCDQFFLRQKRSCILSKPVENSFTIYFRRRPKFRSLYVLSVGDQKYDRQGPNCFPITLGFLLSEIPNLPKIYNLYSKAVCKMNGINNYRKFEIATHVETKPLELLLQLKKLLKNTDGYSLIEILVESLDSYLAQEIALNEVEKKIFDQDHNNRSSAKNGSFIITFPSLLHKVPDFSKRYEIYTNVARKVDVLEYADIFAFGEEKGAKNKHFFKRKNPCENLKWKIVSYLDPFFKNELDWQIFAFDYLSVSNNNANIITHKICCDDTSDGTSDEYDQRVIFMALAGLEAKLIAANLFGSSYIQICEELVRIFGDPKKKSFLFDKIKSQGLRDYSQKRFGTTFNDLMEATEYAS